MLSISFAPSCNCSSSVVGFEAKIRRDGEISYYFFLLIDTVAKYSLCLVGTGCCACTDFLRA